MHIAQKFEGLLEMYRHPDGRRWSGQEIDEATGGVVTRSYITNLRKGRIENPGFEKLKAITKVMDFPPELWFEESPGLRDGLPIDPVPGHLSIGEKTNRLFERVQRVQRAPQLRERALPLPAPRQARALRERRAQQQVRQRALLAPRVRQQGRPPERAILERRPQVIPPRPTTA